MYIPAVVINLDALYIICIKHLPSLAGKKHCGDVCGCKRSRKVEGHDRLRLQQTRQLMMMMIHNIQDTLTGLFQLCQLFRDETSTTLLVSSSRFISNKYLFNIT